MITRLVRLELASLFFHRSEDPVGDRLGNGKFFRARMRFGDDGCGDGGRCLAFELIEPVIHLFKRGEDSGKLALAVLLEDL